MKNHWQGHKGWLSLSIGLVVVAGCATPNKLGSDESIGSAGGRGTAVPAGAGNFVGEKGQSSATGEQGVDPILTNGTVKEPTVDAEGLAPVDTAKAVMIKASQGGTYVSEDGSLKAVIPPGALSQDTFVKFVRLDTSKEKNTNQFLAGMRFQMDLGDAYITPGQKLMVSAKADDRLIGELKGMYEDYTPERYSLSQDDKGQWVIAMPVEGPALKQVDLTTPPADKFMTERRGIMAEGMAPLPAGKGGNFKKDSRIEAFCNYYPPPPPKPLRLMAVQTKWESDDPSLDGKPAYDSNPAHNSYVKFGNTTTTSVAGVTGYWTKEFVAGAPAKAEVSHWEVVTSADSNGMRTDKGNLIKYGSTDWTWTLMQKYDDEFFWPPPKPKATPTPEPTPTPDPVVDPAPADGAAGTGGTGGATDANQTLYKLAQTAKTLDLLKADLVGKTFVSLNSSDDLIVKVVDQAAQPATADSWVDKWNAGWIDLSSNTNETVRSGYNWNGWCYCSWTVYRENIVSATAPQPVGTDGKAYNYARETFTIGVQGFTNGPNPTPGKNPGAGIGSTAKKTIVNGYRVLGANDMEVLVPKYSPMFGITLSSPDLKMEGEVDIVLSVDGVDRPTVSFKANGGNSMGLNWRILMPDNNVHKLSVKDIRTRDGSLFATPASLATVQNLSVQRNGIYDGFVFNLVPAAAK